jgi:hypothetical protein
MKIGEGLGMFLKSKYYPVDIDKKIIYNTPKNKFNECFLPGLIGIKGKRLIAYKCYLSFEIK